MNKQLETLAVMAALAATAFLLFRAWRDGQSLGTLGATAKTPGAAGGAAVYKTYTPNAGDLWGSTPPQNLAFDPDAGAGLRALYL